MTLDIESFCLKYTPVSFAWRIPNGDIGLSCGRVAVDIQSSPLLSRLRSNLSACLNRIIQGESAIVWIILLKQ
jgi:hypothetical protein